ncbi:cilia- and flagella-associated protein 95-like [Amia ocellicauda]|uniref:cilia- and flagella-associated protein 95-like n=1 Tax=Amia ocellicauda TaxID=2972642 RepID=UPI0034642F2B
MYYSRPTLVSNWHQSREAEPKDYDLAACPLGKKHLHHSTYRHLGNTISADWGTTSEAQLSQYFIKKDYEIRETPKPLLKTDNLLSINFDRETWRPRTGFEAVLPCHPPGHNKIDLNTTYAMDYLPPYPLCMYNIQPSAREQPDCSLAYKRCQSQFTDTADYRRKGRNTWQDESGLYSNRDIKSRVTQPSDPITLHVISFPS